MNYQTSAEFLTNTANHPWGPNSVGVVTPQTFSFASKEEPFLLDSGECLSEVTITYETYGQLNTERSNAILITHALSGSGHAAGYHSEEDSKPGWWDDCIGPGKAFDTNRFFVICSNVLGGCYGTTGPSSIDPATGKPYGLNFPVVTIGDMVRAQVKLIDSLGIAQLLSVAGGSMGGMQALEWAAHHPTRLKSAIPLATTAHHSPMLIAFSEVGRQAIYADPAWNYGDYYDKPQKPDAGLAVARMVGHITYLSEESMQQKFGRRLRGIERYGYEFKTEFEIESYLSYNGSKFTERFDANSYLYVTKALDYFDLSPSEEPLATAFMTDSQDDNQDDGRDIKYLVVSFTSDWLYPSYHSKELVSALTGAGADVTYLDIQSTWGHDAFLLEVETMTELLGSFLDRLVREEGISEHDAYQMNSTPVSHVPMKTTTLTMAQKMAQPLPSQNGQHLGHQSETDDASPASKPSIDSSFVQNFVTRVKKTNSTVNSTEPVS
ncbi:MAG: homoserine O-acetyltransferase [Chloroflexota bacterium]